MVIRHPIFFWYNRRKARLAQEVAATEREADARDRIAQLSARKEAVEGYLILRQRRNHWQESIADMISGRP